MSSIEAKEVCRRLVDLLGMKRAELSVWSGITEIERELAGLDLYRHSVRPMAA